jgi:lysophospholipase L1-like esterase
MRWSLPLLCCAVQAADIIVFGDSWGTYGAVSFDKMAANHGLTVSNVAVSGSTAAEWAADPLSLKKVVDDNPDAKFVWLTIGGNDARPKMELGLPIVEIVKAVLVDIQTFLDPYLKAYPSLKLVTFGYDVLFWGYLMCQGTGEKMFKPYCGPKTGADYITCANQLFYAIQFQCTDVLARNYPNQVFSPNLLGSWQTAGGVPGAGIGKPIDSVFSPNEFTGPTKLCLHANDKGYDVIFTNLWDLFFKNHVESDFVGSDSFWKQQYTQWAALCKDTRPQSADRLENFKLNYMNNIANATRSVPLCEMAS